MNEYLFSIVIPIYNEGEDMRKSIESILQQENNNYNDFEIILVDDGSKDCSIQICDEYAKEYSFINAIHKENGGSVDARRVGIEIAKGKYIVFVDGDDYVEKDYIENLHQAVKQEADYYILNSKYRYFDTNKLELQKKDLEDGYIGITETSNWILGGIDGYLWNKIYVTDIIRKNNIQFSKKIIFGDDIYMNLLYLRYVNKIYVQNTASYVHVWDTPTSVCYKNVSIKRLNEIDIVFDEVCNYIKDMKLDQEIYNHFINSDLAVLITTISFLVSSKISKKKIKEALEESKIMKSISEYKPSGLKNKMYHFMITKKQIILIYVLYMIKEKIKELKLKGDKNEKKNRNNYNK